MSSKISVGDIIAILADLILIEDGHADRCRIIKWELGGCDRVHEVTTSSDMMLLSLLLYTNTVSYVITSSKGVTTSVTAESGGFYAVQNVVKPMVEALAEDDGLRFEFTTLDKTYTLNLTATVREFRLGFFLPLLGKETVVDVMKGLVSALMAVSTLKKMSVLGTFTEFHVKERTVELQLGGGVITDVSASGSAPIHEFHAAACEGHALQMRDACPTSTILDASGQRTQIRSP